MQTLRKQNKIVENVIVKLALEVVVAVVVGIGVDTADAARSYETNCLQ